MTFWYLIFNIEQALDPKCGLSNSGKGDIKSFVGCTLNLDNNLPRKGTSKRISHLSAVRTDLVS